MAFVGENRLSQIFQLIKDTFAASDHRHTSLGSSTSTVLSVDTTYYSVAEGGGTTASGYYSHAEGVGGSATGAQAHSEGASCTASGGQSHAEGTSSTASGTQSHAEGYNVTASGSQAHAEGSMTNASGDQAHTEGSSTSASGDMAHAEGQGTKASSDAQHVEGKYNVEDANGTYAHIIGGGSGNGARKNIHTVDWSGNAIYAGDVTATETIVENNVSTTVTHNLTEKAGIASPSFSGVPTAPTAATGTDTTQIATTEFVMNAIDDALGDILDANF